MLALLGFLIILGPLVIVHEFGHYSFARLFGVKAEIFSIGFGPRLWKRQLGETELRVSAIPLGGYVKLLGEDREAELSPEEQKRALHRQAPWKRFFIFAGGPLFNFLMAILVFMAIMVIGEPKVSSVIGRVVRGSVAEKAGFQSGDRVVSIQGKPVKGYEDILAAISENPGKPLKFEVVHKTSATPVEVTATPQAESGFSVYGESTHVGDIDGMTMMARSTVTGVSNPASPAAQAGIRTGDQITKINDVPVSSWEDLEQFYSSTDPKLPIRLEVKKAKDGAVKTFSFTKPNPSIDMGRDWGLHSSELFIEKAIPSSPAEKAGVQKGDRLIGVGGLEVQSFYELREAIQKAGEKDGKVFLRWERDGKPMSSMITPTATSGRDPALKKTVQYTVGVAPMLVPAEPVTYIERIWNPFVLAYQATERVISFTWRNFVAIRKMITGDVSVGTLGGPIMIGKIAGESLTHGLTAFLATMAVLSIGLGVLNILPVPVLDGGHLLLLAIEIVRGKPLTIRTMEIIQLVGLSLILLLMAVVIRNDLTRLVLG